MAKDQGCSADILRPLVKFKNLFRLENSYFHAIKHNFPRIRLFNSNFGKVLVYFDSKSYNCLILSVEFPSKVESFVVRIEGKVVRPNRKALFQCLWLFVHHFK